LRGRPVGVGSGQAGRRRGGGGHALPRAGALSERARASNCHSVAEQTENTTTAGLTAAASRCREKQAVSCCSAGVCIVSRLRRLDDDIKSTSNQRIASAELA